MTIQCNLRRHFVQKRNRKRVRLERLHISQRRRNEASLLIQCQYRRYRAKLVRNELWLQHQHKAASKIQAVWKGGVEREAVRLYIMERNEIMTLAAVRLQAFFRCVVKFSAVKSSKRN
eukprot:NODE_3478_length_770_cov_82.762829_g2909_i0.p1 GENE.NODE_3478_length_770_cov_82.762829_g2909_i0~~NODE_3478_length_770_cov_82.762829_g2909_i0.p1  ORF type:complete len:118 (+),score=34.90 NODE_3478_length_770_cov_82.762829_g2909_i0:242-595(+)